MTSLAVVSHYGDIYSFLAAKETISISGLSVNVIIATNSIIQNHNLYVLFVVRVGLPIKNERRLPNIYELFSSI